MSDVGLSKYAEKRFSMKVPYFRRFELFMNRVSRENYFVCCDEAARLLEEISFPENSDE